MAWIIPLPLEPGEASVCVSNFSSSCVAIGLVQCEAALGEEIREKITRLKWSLILDQGACDAVRVDGYARV